LRYVVSFSAAQNTVHFTDIVERVEKCGTVSPLAGAGASWEWCRHVAYRTDIIFTRWNSVTY